MSNDLPWNFSCVLFWLPAEMKQLPADFDLYLSTQEPPHPNPHPWWVLDHAIEYAIESAIQDGRTALPWIKYGEIVMAPADVAAAYKAIKSRGDS